MLATAANDVSDRGQRKRRQRVARTPHASGAEPEPRGCHREAEGGGTARVRVRELPDTGEGEAEAVPSRHARQAGRAAVGLVVLSNAWDPPNHGRLTACYAGRRGAGRVEPALDVIEDQLQKRPVGDDEPGAKRHPLSE